MTEFVQDGSRHVSSMQAMVTTFHHPATGARHIHLASDDTERAFLVAFPTLPMASDGRAHVLEHLLLCGSRRFPVRDPFFAMRSRSLATFMNAMTYPDRTVYPFATPDKTDFFNLLDVYLDATFFPKLDPLDFLQEGWRPVIEDGQLALQGVVLNEMKGSYADPGRHLSLGLNRALLPGTTYAVDSGGDPLLIPELTHAALLDFHAQHYHPSQAVFMTWGDLDAAEVQARISAQVLSAFDGQRALQLPTMAPPWQGTRELSIDLPAPQATADEHGLQLAWLMGPQSDLAAVTRLKLVEAALLGQGGGVLRQAIEAAGLGRLAPHTGLDDNSTQLFMHVGLAGLQQAQLGPARAVILGALEQAARDGVPQDILRASLRDLRYRQRRVTSGVNRLIGLAQLAVRQQDVLAALDDQALLAQLAQEIEAPDFLRVQLRYLLDQAPALAAHMRPDTGLIPRREAAAAQSIQAWQTRLTAPERVAIEAQMQALAAHQGDAAQPGVYELLPRIVPADLPREPRALLALAQPLWQDHAVSLPTNGISRADLKLDLNALDPADWPWLDLYVDLLPQLGAQGMDHQAAAVWRRLRVSQFHVHCGPFVTLAGEARLELTLGAQALREEQGQIPEVLAAWWLSPDLGDGERLRYLIGNRIQGQLAALGEQSAQFASLAAMAQVSVAGQYEQQVRGVAALPFLARLQALLRGGQAGLAEIEAALRRVHGLLLASPRALLCAGIEQDAQALLPALQAALGPTPAGLGPSLPPSAATAALLALGFFAPAQVNHCLAVWQVPGIGHADAPALAVLAELLQQRLLHPLLREQGGAYGAQAHYEPESGVFLVASTADPRLAATYRDIAASLQQVQTQAFSAVALEEAILSVIKQLDPPSRGAAALQQAWSLGRRGIGQHQRRSLRRGVLDCTLAELRRVAAIHLDWSRAHRVAAVGRVDQDLAGLAVLDVPKHVAGLGLGA